MGDKMSAAVPAESLINPRHAASTKFDRKLDAGDRTRRIAKMHIRAGWILCATLLIGTAAKLTAASDVISQFEFALYFAPSPTRDPETALKELLRDKYAHAFPTSHDNSHSAELRYRWVATPDFAPPSPRTLQYFGRGVSPETNAAIGKSPRVLVISFRGPRNQLLTLNRTAENLLADLADAVGGLPWDEECRLLYSASVWRERRVNSWEGDLPNMQEEVTMHCYRDPELDRVITLGMRKFGLPDLVIDQLPDSDSRAAGNTINACAQILIEGPRPPPRDFLLKLASIRQSKMRAAALTNPGKGAAGEVRVRFASATREDGDPANILWKLEFPEYANGSVTERELIAFATLFGATDQVVQPSDKNGIRMASERARAAFFAQAPIFRQGLAPNERLMVKKGFRVSRGTEYMWVEVTRWHENAVEGILANDSDYDSNLRAGQRVTVGFDEIYDYIHYKPDGTQEGNETAKFLEGP